jgi:hypothetical protein
LKNGKSPGSDQSLMEMIQAGDEILQSEIHKLVNFISNEEKLADEWKEFIIILIYEKNDKTN